VEKSYDAALQTRSGSRSASRMGSAAYVSITGKGGVVEAWGMVGSLEQRDALMVLVEEAAGDAKVQDHLKVGVPSTTYGWGMMTQTRAHKCDETRPPWPKPRTPSRARDV
jgi:hypothetical protein